MLAVIIDLRGHRQVSMGTFLDGQRGDRILQSKNTTFSELTVRASESPSTSSEKEDVSVHSATATVAPQ